jgi:hypothetical protein
MSHTQQDEKRTTGRHGKVAGIPYDTRPPTRERAKSTYWNSESTRLFPPKVFGLGWTINFYWIAHPFSRGKARRVESSSEAGSERAAPAE